MAGGHEDRIRGRPDQADDRPLLGDIGGLDPLEEAHLLQIGQSVIAHAGLDIQPYRAVPIGELPVLLDVSVGREDECFG